MKKLIFAILACVVLGSSLYAIEDGTYNCISVKVYDSKNKIYYKIPEDKQSFGVLKVKGQKIYDKNEVWNYAFSKDNFDVFSLKNNSNVVLIVPSNDVNDKIFSIGVGINTTFKEVIFACKRAQ